MDAIRRFARPTLRRPRAIVAFEGWNDACDAASGAALFLLGHYDVAEPFAVLDPEDFFDFQSLRPTVSTAEGDTRRLEWPLTSFYAVELPERDHDLVIVVGDEPHLRWKTFARLVTTVLSDCDVDETVLLGAFIGQIPHTIPVPLIGVATDPSMLTRHDLMTSDYEGPTGIVGVLQEACRERGMRAVSVWAATPHYLAANPNPKATLALVEKAAAIADVPVDATELEKSSVEFTDKVDTAMEASDDLASYVAELEDEAGDQPPSQLDPKGTTQLVSEIEDFLRDQS